MRSRLFQDPPRGLQPVIAGPQRQLGFLEVFVRQGSHGFGIHVRRIGDDQVIAQAGHPGPQVGFDQADAVLHAVPPDIDPGYFQRIRRQVDRIDVGIRVVQRSQDGEAARTGAQVQRRMHQLRVFDPRFQGFGQQLGDERTRHDHPLVHVEVVPGQPGFVRQVGGGQTLAHPALDHGKGGIPLGRQQPAVQQGVKAFQRQVQGVRQQVGRLVPGVVGAVAEYQPGLLETRDGKAQHVAHGVEGMAGFCVHGEKPSVSLADSRLNQCL